MEKETTFNRTFHKCGISSEDRLYTSPNASPKDSFWRGVSRADITIPFGQVNKFPEDYKYSSAKYYEFGMMNLNYLKLIYLLPESAMYLDFRPPFLLEDKRKIIGLSVFLIDKYSSDHFLVERQRTATFYLIRLLTPEKFTKH